MNPILNPILYPRLSPVLGVYNSATKYCSEANFGGTVHTQDGKKWKETPNPLTSQCLTRIIDMQELIKCITIKITVKSKFLKFCEFEQQFPKLAYWTIYMFFDPLLPPPLQGSVFLETVCQGAIFPGKGAVVYVLFVLVY